MAHGLDGHPQKLSKMGWVKKCDDNFLCFVFVRKLLFDMNYNYTNNYKSHDNSYFIFKK